MINTLEKRDRQHFKSLSITYYFITKRTHKQTTVELIKINDDFERFYYLLLMLQHYTIDMPIGINQFVVNITQDTLIINITLN